MTTRVLIENTDGPDDVVITSCETDPETGARGEHEAYVLTPGASCGMYVWPGRDLQLSERRHVEDGPLYKPEAA